MKPSRRLDFGITSAGRLKLRPVPARQPGIRFAYLADPEGNLIKLLVPAR
jgi:hypothetical protein